ncbi:helix-turn-helix domain-containing protein, partial [Caballeronia sp. GaOx3]
MKRQRKPWLNSKDSQQIWRRWSEGESLSEIARGLQREVSSIHRVVSEHGGIVPRARSRSTRVLALRERDEISRGLSAGESIRQIAQRLQRAASTISREVQRNGGVLK